MARPGRVAVLERIEDLREQNAVDLAVMNAENVAGGFSITPSMAEELFDAGIDVMTSGNSLTMRDCTGVGVGLPFLRRWLNHRKSVANRAEPTPSACGGY